MLAGRRTCWTERDTGERGAPIPTMRDGNREWGSSDRILTLTLADTLTGQSRRWWSDINGFNRAWQLVLCYAPPLDPVLVMREHAE